MASTAVSASEKKDVVATISERKESVDQGRGPEDGEFSRDGSSSADSLGKRKARDPEPESPERSTSGMGPQPTTTPFRKKERTYFDDIGQDSPASYPKHVMVPEHQGVDHDSKDDFADAKAHSTAPLLTPDSISQRRQASFEVPVYCRPTSYRQDSYHAPSYSEAGEYARASYSVGSDHAPPRGDAHPTSSRTRRWACDFCNVATFLSYEEACAHEEVCARQHGTVAQNPRQPPTHLASTSHNSSFGVPPPPPHQQHPGMSVVANLPPHQGGGGMMYHPTQGPSMGSQEVVTPPTPHRHYGRQWGSRGPPLPVLPHEHGYYHGYYERDDPAFYQQPEQFYSPQHSQSYGGYGTGGSSSQGSPPGQSGSMGMGGGHHVQGGAGGNYQKRMLLAMPADSESLSDRQCYVRSEMCEIFAATEQDVAARHSKGAQKLVAGQVGIRCIHCAHLRPRDRAERAVCYPSSISRIYQTVADMQRFHFEHCKEIPQHVSNVYKNLKTTRPRGVGSPQTYWIDSAKHLGLVDTGGGIRFDTDADAERAASKDPALKQPRFDLAPTSSDSLQPERPSAPAPAATAQQA
eukprot:CAMPEP_0172441296 /NCGR_PEP_ID=MMETSP1065-20121228/1834_1 /TAXON_ID=265537 /ORGANISM="Amphiprora paludosa, Strain CCMP125" /LENGTH=576 /DNA_ID=CAMNT_0013190561 /DNA_START=97 /DNA_END=1827 /DNA_ORIENTATION=+